MVNLRVRFDGERGSMHPTENEILQKNVSLLSLTNKQLESLIENYKVERQKLLEEIEDLKARIEELEDCR